MEKWKVNKNDFVGCQMQVKYHNKISMNKYKVCEHLIVQCRVLHDPCFKREGRCSFSRRFETTASVRLTSRNNNWTATVCLWNLRFAFPLQWTHVGTIALIHCQQLHTVQEDVKNSYLKSIIILIVIVTLRCSEHIVSLEGDHIIVNLESSHN